LQVWKYSRANPQKSRPAAAGLKRRAHCGLPLKQIREPRSQELLLE
jgi:hypothetical protein